MTLKPYTPKPECRRGLGSPRLESSMACVQLAFGFDGLGPPYSPQAIQHKASFSISIKTVL